MEFFKIFLIKNSWLGEVPVKLSRLCSDTPLSITFDKVTHLAVRYSPETYFSNLSIITKMFKKRKAKPLLMTNYKFLILLKELSNFGLRLKNIDVKGEEFEDLLKMLQDNVTEVELLSAYLDENRIKINFFEFALPDERNYIKVNVNGIISLTKGFAEVSEMNSILSKVVSLLLEGKL